RRPLYARAHAAVDVDGLTPEQVASEIVRLVGEARRHLHDEPDESDPLSAGDPRVAATVHAPGGSYPIIVAPGAIADVGPVCLDLGLRGRAFIIVDEVVEGLYAPAVSASLQGAGFTVVPCTIPSGEQHKTLETVARVYDFLLG